MNTFAIIFALLAGVAVTLAVTVAKGLIGVQVLP